ncbi:MULTISPECIES: beta-glucoside-specific PTS transporter subunit IIABC [Liquorilactobacillus]|uniref:beta-glucoside-specific PTS transporter subunit IIABC n=1 Tax=Liquorilactobacillus TaxID=2767888 RepID=UPI0039EC276D
MDDKQLAMEILRLLGGKKNVSSVTHCVTRLRVSVNDTKSIKKNEIQSLKNVLGVNIVGNQLQVVLGGKVVDVYDQFVPLVGKVDSDGVEKNNGNLIDRFLDTLSGIFTPIIPAIVGAGLLKGIMIFLMFYKLVSTSSDLYKFLNIFSDSAFYFLPILLAISTAARFKCNQYIAVAIAGILLHPNLITMMAHSNSLKFIGIPVTNASYSSSVLPIIFGILLMSYVEKWLNKVVPKILRMILVPVLTVLIVAPIVLIVIGPIGTVVGDAIGQGFIQLYLKYGVIAGILFGLAYPYLVIMGMHVGFGPVMVQSLSKYGVDYIMGPTVASNSAEAGATFAVFLKTKNEEFKAIAGAAALNAIIGITEPALFGVTSKLKRPLIAVSAGGAVGGAIAGYFKVTALGMGTGPIAGIPLFLGATFIYFIISSVASFVVAFVLTPIIGFEDIPVKKQDEKVELDEKLVTRIAADQTIDSPVSGEVIQLQDVKDGVFSEKMMGDGIAIQPTRGEVVAPFAGVVSATFATKHAIGLKSYDGCEVLIHVGLDTVKLNGKGFEVLVNKGDSINKGDLLLKFDMKEIRQAGYDIVTPVIITNTDMYEKINKTAKDNINAGEELLNLVAKKK